MTAFGWCIAFGPPAMPQTWRHGTWRAKSFEDLALLFGQCLQAEEPDLVVYEEPLQVIVLYGKKQLIHLPGGNQFFTPNASQTILWKIEGMMRGVCAIAEVPCLGVPPKTWRATVLGDGNLPKDRAKLRAQQTCAHLQIPIKSVDEAEACCVALHGLSTVEFRDAERRDVHGRALGGSEVWH